MVHTFTALGQYLVADVNSGAVHVLDKLSYDLLSQVEGEDKLGESCPREVVERLPQYSPAELEETWQELRSLQEQGLLFSDDDYLDPEAAMELPRQAVVKALCLHVSHDCNLRCRYCFAGTGDFGTGHRMTMDAETAKKAIDWVVAKSGKRRNIEIDFFGGEPLMAMDTVKEAVAYARSLEKEHDKVFRFTITTNGMLLNDENIDYINREMSNVVLSLDGRKEVNDHMRPTAGGKGSYDVIVPKFQKLVAGRGTKDYYARGTFTRENLDFSADVMHLADLGFRHVSVEPASGPLDDPFAIKEEDLAQVEAEYEKLARELMGRKDVNSLRHQAAAGLRRRVRVCGRHPRRGHLPLPPVRGEGGVPHGQRVRRLLQHGHLRQVRQPEHLHPPRLPGVLARFYCSGGCSASNLLVNGDISLSNEVACEMERKRLECAIALKAIAAGMGEAPNTEGNYTSCNQCEDCQKAE